MKELVRIINRLRGRARGGPIALHKHKAVYIPIPKVACSSLTKFCADLLKIEEGQYDNIHSMYLPRISLDRLEGHENYFKFAFVRNPWDRLVSCYTNKISTDPLLNNKHYVNGVANSLAQHAAFKAGMTFQQFVETIADWPDETADPHFKSQYLFLVGKDGKLVADFVGRFETLQRDFDDICIELGISNSVIPHLRKSSHNKYLKYYTNELISIVGERYRQDIELFKYEF